MVRKCRKIVKTYSMFYFNELPPFFTLKPLIQTKKNPAVSCRELLILK